MKAITYADAVQVVEERMQDDSAGGPNIIIKNIRASTQTIRPQTLSDDMPDAIRATPTVEMEVSIIVGPATPPTYTGSAMPRSPVVSKLTFGGMLQVEIPMDDGRISPSVLAVTANDIAWKLTKAANLNAKDRAEFCNALRNLIPVPE